MRIGWSDAPDWAARLYLRQIDVFVDHRVLVRRSVVFGLLFV